MTFDELVSATTCGSLNNVWTSYVNWMKVKGLFWNFYIVYISIDWVWCKFDKKTKVEG